MSSIIDQDPFNEYTGNGAATVYPYTFHLLSAGDLAVTIDLVPTTAFTLSGVGNQSGGEVTFSTAPANLSKILISRQIELSRDTDYQYNGELREATLDRDFNRIWQALQEWRATTGGAVRSPYPIQMAELPGDPADFPGYFLGIDSSGNPTYALAPAGTAADVVTRLASTASPSDGAGMVGVDFADVALREYLHETNGRTAAEIAAGVTPTNYAYPPRHSRRYGAVGDGSDETTKIQALIDVCEADGWAPAYIQDRVRLGSSVIIDRPVDSSDDEFRIIGIGRQAGFYTTGNVTMFDSSLAVTVDPVSEFVTFERIRFASSSFFNVSYVLSKKFLRIKFSTCFFWLVRCQLSDIYAQTVHFISCNIRNSPSGFVNCAGSYDISFEQCIIENNFNLFRSIDLSRGTNGFRLVNSTLEGQQESTVIATGVAGFVVSFNHIEANQINDFNFFGGVLTNKSITVKGNYIWNPGGETFYHGPCESVTSSGNTCFPSVMHGNAAQVTNFVSTADNCVGGVTDATVTRTVNGVVRAGNSQDVWACSANQITKDAAGNFGFSTAALASTRMVVQGKDQTNTAYAGQWLDSGGNVILSLRNDRAVLIPVLQNAVNDAAAAGLGVPVGGMYRNASVMMVRVV